MKVVMLDIDEAMPIRFLRTAYHADDWIAVFLKTYRTGETAQRVLPVSAAITKGFQAWLERRNAHGWNVYVSVNAVRPGRSRTKRAIARIRHVFLEEDADGLGLLAALTTRPDLPPPSYVLHSSPGRLHVLWRSRGFDCESVETLQKTLATELKTDSAATSCAQTTRLPGFVNHKHTRPWRVTVEYLRPQTALTVDDFPRAASTRHRPVAPSPERSYANRGDHDRMNRARRFLRSVEPAVSGKHGDARTFRICCRLVRGFALNDDEALDVLRSWNARCEPPWAERDLRNKLRNARQYGREPFGGLLTT